jgi:hypothetical protein
MGSAYSMKKRSAYTKLEGKRSLGKPRHRREDTIKMDLTEKGLDGMDYCFLPMSVNSNLLKCP